MLTRYMTGVDRVGAATVSANLFLQLFPSVYFRQIFNYSVLKLVAGLVNAARSD